MFTLRGAGVVGTTNLIIHEHSAKVDLSTEILEQEIETDEVVKYKLNEVVNLYQVLPKLAFTPKEAVKIIMDINFSNIKMNDLVNYIGKQNKEQKYNDYSGVPITLDTISKLKSMISS